MKELFKHIKADKIIRWGMTAASFLLIIEIAYILIIYNSLPPYLPLFNQMPWGENRLGSKIEIFLPILITLAFFGVNIFLIAKLYTNMPLAARILGITTLLATVLSTIFIVRTLLLII